MKKSKRYAEVVSKVDKKKAFELFQRAADGGNSEAKININLLKNDDNDDNTMKSDS